MTNMIGHVICVRCKDGAIYEGILSAVNWMAGTKGLLLKQAKKILSRNDKAEKPKAEYTITREDFVSLATKADIDLYNDELTEAARRRGGGIEVDSEIEVSGGRAAFGTERDLVMASAWVGDGDGSLEGLSGGGGGVQRGWDQFAVNKQLGVTSSYSDELYTTKLSDKKFSAEQLRRAERLAKEIESGTTSNAHIAEERGQKELEEDDEGLTVRFRSGGLREIAEHLFTWGSDIRIVSPEELRTMMKDRLLAAQSIVGNDLQGCERH